MRATVQKDTETRESTPVEMKRNENCENVGAQVMRIGKGSQNPTAGRERTGGDRSQERVRTSADDARSCYGEEPNAADQVSQEHLGCGRQLICAGQCHVACSSGFRKVSEANKRST